MAEPKTEPESDLTAEALAAALALFLQNKLQELYDNIAARQLRMMEAELEVVHVEIEELPDEPWSNTRRAAVIAIIALAMRRISSASLAQMKRDLSVISLESRNAMVSYLDELDTKILGDTTKLKSDTMEWWEKAEADIRKKRMRQYTASWRRYAAVVTQQIVDALEKAVQIGKPWSVANTAVWSTIRHVVKKTQWMVDGILKTEASAAWNGTALAVMIAENSSTDPMMKKLVTTFDRRTGRDSVALHGQTRPVNEPFYDRVNGITYMAPPNRPRDREMIVPWRASYEAVFDDYTRDSALGYDPEIHGKRKRLSGAPKGAPKPAPKITAKDAQRAGRAKRAARLRVMRAERRRAVEELRRTRTTIEAMRQNSSTDPTTLIELTALRAQLRHKVEEQSSRIESIQAR